VRKLIFTALGTAVLALAGGVAAAPARATVLPEVIALPNGFAPEGIATGPGATFYAGSLAGGAIYRGSLLTGEGAILVPATAGGSVNGLEVSGGRLFAAGGSTGTVKVYDARTGALLLDTAVGGFVNDVVVTPRAAYYTDSQSATLYVLPLGPGGRLGEVRPLPTTIPQAAGFNANGIEASPDGRTLLVVQSNTGLLWRVSTATGEATPVDLGGVSLANGDGLLRRGTTLYVVQNQLNQIAVLRLGPGYQTARLVRTITDPRFQVPTTVDAFGPYLYAVNARFGTPVTPETTYTIVRVR
jgi:sugar lactone lactonase YvrE